MAADLELPPVDRSGSRCSRFDDLGKVFKQHGHDIHALTGVSAVDLARRDARARRRVGQRQDDAGANAARHRRADDAAPSRSTGSRSRRGSASASSEEIRALQIVFQNPDDALNRRHSVQRILRRSLRKLAGLTGAAAERRMLELMQSVRLAERYVSARPGQLSGGLKQRLAIARAFAGEPKLVVCDEPTSALDVSVQAAILNLLVELQAQTQVSYLFISHDLGVVRYVSDRIAVLYLGRLMELGPAEVVFDGPHHPYTEALLSAVPTIDGGGRDRIKLEGEIPSAANPPTGCVFHTRCPRFLGDDLRRAGAAAGRGRAGPSDALPHPARRAARAAEDGSR